MLSEYRLDREKKLKVQKTTGEWFIWNKRYVDTYLKIVGEKFSGKIIDLGCGDGSFIRACKRLGYNIDGIDSNRVDFEKDKLPYKNKSINVVHINAVIEHLINPENILKETYRVLDPKGIVIINTPNWQQDFKNFYNDPTHKKPYTPISLTMMMEMFKFRAIFLEPALIDHGSFFWHIPEKFKWCVAKYICRGTRSILCIAEKCV